MENYTMLGSVNVINNQGTLNILLNEVFFVRGEVSVNLGDSTLKELSATLLQ